MSAAWLKGFWNHPAGPKTIHFWVSGADQQHSQVMSCLAQVCPLAHRAFQRLMFSRCMCIHAQAPTFKWGISIANLADMQRPAENVSYPQQLAVTATGIIWSRFATQVSRVKGLLADGVIHWTANRPSICMIGPRHARE